MVALVRILCILLLVALPASADDRDVNHAAAELLSRRCLQCHAGATAEGKLDLTRRKSALHGGEQGAAIVPGDVEGSLIWQRVAADEMPEDKPLSESERALLRRWIESGAEWSQEPLDLFRTTTDTRAGYDWWAFQPLREPALPTHDRAWARNAIDAFVSARMQEHALTPSRPADDFQLVRRLVFNVTGLPPTRDMMERLDDAPDWYERFVDELLASPRYGQRWARHWLDVVRFGESHGFEYNQPRNHAWRYRNWVIDALNHDMAYDVFVRMQIAGDVEHPRNPEGWAALGFMVAGPHNTTKPSSDKMRMTMRHDELEDIVGTIGQTFLGLTINCARCHDHKFDPISQEEYYQLVASVVGIDHGERELPDPRADQAKRDLQGVVARLKELRRKQTELEKAKPPESELTELRQVIAKWQDKERHLRSIPIPKVYTAISQAPQQVSRLKRGDVSLPAEVVQPAGLRAINGDLATFELAAKSGDDARRAELADWLTGNQNPLLARVIVNRIWHYHFGQGLVRTPSDFGFNGDRPSHPMLLDFLAAKLLEHDWNLKPIHRLILTSATYRQSGHPRGKSLSVDAENRYLWRMSPRRLTAEEIRDAMLAVTGKLLDVHGGPGYRDVREYKYRGSHYYDPVEPAGADAVRRTVYRFSPRGAKRTMLDTFDCPDPSAKAPKRAVTTTPLQALSLMNNSFVLGMAEDLATRVQGKHRSSQDAVAQVYRLLYARTPEQGEVERAVRFVKQHGLVEFCRVLFNSNEFLYVR